MSGWIKFHRKSIKNPVFKKPLTWHYWQYCLLKANHDPKKIIWNKKEMIIERGSFITGRRQAAKETGLSQQNIRTATRILINMTMLEKSTSKSTSKFTYLTICKYEQYQARVINNQPANQPASNQQVTTNKNVKKLKKLKNEKKEPLPPIVPQGGNGMVKERFDKFINLFPNSVKRSEAWTAWQQLFIRGYAGRRCTTKFLCPLTDDLFNTIIEAVEAQTKERAWKKEAKVWIASWTHPATWLRAKRWEDKTYPEPEETVRKFEFLPEEEGE